MGDRIGDHRRDRRTTSLGEGAQRDAELGRYRHAQPIDSHAISVWHIVVLRNRFAAGHPTTKTRYRIATPVASMRAALQP